MLDFPFDNRQVLLIKTRETVQGTSVSTDCRSEADDS